MGYFPGKQTAKPSKSPSKSTGGGGGGSSSPTPYKTSPALSDEVNTERMEANRAAGVGDSSGRSPSDPNYGTAPKAPSSQFRTSKGASELQHPSDTERQILTQSLAFKQEVSRAGRAYATSAWGAVISSPSRRIEREEEANANTYRTYNISGGKVRDTGVVSYQPQAQEPQNGMSERSLPIYGILTPETQENKLISVGQAPEIRQSSGFFSGSFWRGAQTGAQTVGYMVGEPIRTVGHNIQKYSTQLNDNLESRFPRKQETVNVYGREINVTPPSVLKAAANIGSYIEGVGLEFKEHPVKAIGTTALFTGLTYGLNIVGLGARTVASKIPLKVIPASIKQKTGTLISYGLAGTYGYLAGKRISASDTPYETAGRITASEVLPMFAGAKLGSDAWLKTQGLARTWFKGTKEVPIDKLAAQEVLTRQQNFPTAPANKHLSIFKSGKYSFEYATGTKGKPSYPHATPSLFGKKFDTQAGARPQEAAGLYVSGKGASTYFLRIGSQDVTYYPGKLFPEATTPTLVYVRPSDVKLMPSGLKTGYGQNTNAFTWFNQKATKGVAYVPGVKSEVEAVIPPGTQFILQNTKYHTTYEGIRVPIRQYRLGHFPAEESYYPFEDIIVRTGKVPKYYNPQPSLSISGSMYGVASLKYLTSSQVSQGITSSSYTYSGSSKISTIDYQPYIPKSIVPYTKYSYKAPPSRVSLVPKYSTGTSRTSTLISKTYTTIPERYATRTYVPPRLPPPPKLDLDFFAGKQKPKKHKRIRKPFKYQPSVEAVIRDIREKPNKKRKKRLLSGLRVRPIPVS